MAGRRNAGFRSVRHGDVVPRDDAIAASREEGRQIYWDHDGLFKSVESERKKVRTMVLLNGGASQFIKTM